MTYRFFATLILLSVCGVSVFGEEQKLRAAIIDGQNNHDWKGTTPILKAALERSERFNVDVITSPPRGGNMQEFRPDFGKYDVVVLNYTDFGGGSEWSETVRRDFEEYVADGGGVVAYHAAISAFPKWTKFNKMIGIGGWCGRDEKSGPWLYVKDGRVIRDESPGAAGYHGPQVEFQVKTFDAEHPVMKDLPPAFLHVKDELYGKMRGPAEHVTILATSDSKLSEGGSGREEPILLAVEYGKGRVFVTMLGHDPRSSRCVGFLTTLSRGAEWAATGKVTIPAPNNYPTGDKTSSE
ncbi:MAG: ThuA domain-containing protein [Planctomycetaceae bacterium]|jgi:type 1 glutamine amidotransferase|nr:ThuA domain-containing protein [Planctomycetaceae bacterium]